MESLQVLAGKVFVGELEQILLIEQIHLNATGIDQFANRPTLERRDSLDPGLFTERIDLLLRDHPAIPDQDADDITSKQINRLDRR